MTIEGTESEREDQSDAESRVTLRDNESGVGGTGTIGRIRREQSMSRTCLDLSG
jgi:hypothetical protein